MKSGKELRELGFISSNKYKRTREDEDQALLFLSQAAQCEDLYGTELSECYIKQAEIFRDRIPKTKENHDQALLFFQKASEVPGLPSWFTPQTHAERLALCPDIYGFAAGLRNQKLAEDMHKQNLMIQSGGDLAITAKDWFTHLLETTEIMNPEYTKVGLDYLKSAIEEGWDDLYTSIMYTWYGRAYKYHLDKTKENFDQAKEWLQKSIDLNVNAKTSNQPWTIIGGGSARSYFELAELISNPQRFGFDMITSQQDEGKKILEDGKQHISKYGTLGPYSILENMFVDHENKRFCYKRSEEDIPVIVDLVAFADELNNKKPNGACHMFLGVAYHCLQDKSLTTFVNAVSHYIKSFNNPHDEWVMERIFKYMGPLVLSCVDEGYPKEASESSIAKEAREIMKKVSEGPAAYPKCSQKIADIINICFTVYKVSSVKKDDIIKKRLEDAMTLLLKTVQEKKGKEAAEKAVADIQEVKLKLNEIQSDTQLYGYYDGFVFTCSQAYTTAQVVSSGQVELDTSDPIKSIGLKLISYIPFIGDKISDPLGALADFLKSASMIKNSNYICTLAVNQHDFDELIQDAAIHIISRRKAEIQAYQGETPAHKNWFTNLIQFFKKVKIDIERTIYGLRYRTPIQILGNKDAIDLLSNWIGNGKIYDGKPFLLPEARKEKIEDALLTIAKESQDQPKLTIQPQAPTSAINGSKKSACCNIF